MQSLSETSIEMLIAYFENEIRSHRDSRDFDPRDSLVVQELCRRQCDDVILLLRQRHEVISARMLGESDLNVRDGFAALLVIMLVVVQ